MLMNRCTSVGTVIRSKYPGKILETATLEDETTVSSPDIGNQLHSDAASHHRRTENSNTAQSKPKISQHIILPSIKSHMASSITLLVSDSEVLYSFIRLAVSLTTGPKPLPKWGLHIVRSRASSFKWEYPLLSLRSSSSFLPILRRLSVTSIPPILLSFL